MVFRFENFFSSTPKPNEELNIHVIFKPLYTLITIFGLFPYSIKFQKIKNQYLILPKSIFINSAWVITILLLLYIFIYIHWQYLYYWTGPSDITEGIMIKSNYVVIIAALAIVCTVAYTSSFLHRYSYVKILNNITSIYAELNNDNSQRILSSLRFQINFVILGSIVFIILLQVCVNYARQPFDAWKTVLVIFTFNLPQTVQIVYLYFYYALVIMVVFVLRSLNGQMLRLKVKKPTVANVIKVQKEPCATIRDFERVYVRVIAIKNDINKAFQATILVTTLQCLHCTVSNAYLLYRGSVTGSSDAHTLVNTCIWLGYQFLKIYLLASSGNALKNEKEKIGKTLHGIPTEKQDIRTFIEVQHFSSLMLHQDTGLSIYGYFSLDATLIFTMVATVTTYLTICVQFGVRK